MDYFARTAVQKGLNTLAAINPPLTINGNWGPATQAALKKYQGILRLPLTGQYDSATEALMQPYLVTKYLSTADIQSAATTLNVDMNVILAVALTESSSSGFFPSGDCAILFERHIFFAKLTAKYGQAKAVQWQRLYPNIVSPSAGGYSYGQAEYTRLNLAMTIDPDCALQSASWGLFQIMGFNYADCGYPTVQAYVAAMKVNEQAHLLAFVSFLQRNDGGALLTYLQASNWVQFTSAYNGPANVADYSTKILANLRNAATYLQ